MKLFRFIPFFAIALLAVPAMAQDRSIDVSVFASWVDPSGENTFEVDDTGDFPSLETEFDSEIGFGASVNVFWGGSLSTEFAATIVEPELGANFNDPGLTPLFAAGLEMMPITAVLQWHFNPNGRFDPYIGAGVGYVLFDQIDDEDLEEIDVDEIDFEDDYGFVANLGANVGFTDNFGLYLDAKYIGVQTEATVVIPGEDDEAFEVDVDPIMFSAGVTFRF